MVDFLFDDEGCVVDFLCWFEDCVFEVVCDYDVVVDGEVVYGRVFGRVGFSVFVWVGFVWF